MILAGRSTTGPRCPKGTPGSLRLSLFSLIFAFQLMCVSGLSALDFRSPGDPHKIAKELLANMSDEEILAQTFMLGWVGADPSPLLLEWVEKHHIGGIKIFGWNTEDTARLARTVGILQGAATAAPLKIPLFVATDQEGGWIRHVKGSTSETPGNMAIGASGFPRDALLSGYYIGREISAIGINMNFAPTVDLFTKRDSTLIGPRAFGDDPVQTAILGAAFAKGLERSGVIATAKHYPGHGGTELDSHSVLPSVDSTESMLWERELIPYRLLAKEGIPAVMSGHIAFPRTPAGWEPASMSKWFLTDLLRGKLGYKGLLITDDLLMNGATMSAGSLSRAAKLALEAGNDVILLSSTPLMDDPVWTNLLFAYKNEKAFRARIREAALRNLTLKLDYLRRDTAPPLVPDLATLAEKVPDMEGQHFFLGLAARSVTNIGAGNFPIEIKKDERILIAGQFDEFIAAGNTAYPKARSYRFSYLPFDKALPEEKAQLVHLAKDVDTVIICVANPASLELLQSLKDLGKRIVVISSLTPVYMDKALWVDAAVAVYSYAKESFIAGFSALSGSIPATGKIPFAPRNGTAKEQGQ